MVGDRYTNPFELLQDEVGSLQSSDIVNCRPLTLAKYNIYHVVIFYDTGAPGNLMSKRTYDSFFSHIELLPSDDEKELSDIQGGALKMVGKISMDVTIAGIEFTEEIVVVDGISLPGHLLIGFPAMMRNRIVIDPVQDGVVIKGKVQHFYRPGVNWVYNIESSHRVSSNAPLGNTIPINHKKQKRAKSIKCVTDSRKKELRVPLFSVAKNSVCNVNVSDLTRNLSANQKKTISVKSKVRLKPGQTAVVTCKIDDRTENSIVTLPETQRIKGISVESGVHNIKNRKVKIVLANNLDSEVTIQRGTVVCQAEVYKVPIVEVKEIPSSVAQRIDSIYEESQFLCQRKLAIEQQLNEVDFPDSKQDLLNLLGKYEKIVALRGDKLGSTDKIKHHIAIPPNTPPIYIPAYRVPYSQKEKIDDEVGKLLDQGIIRESNTPWSFPLLCIPKKDGSMRLVVDFRKLNEVTVSDPYPMPSMRDLIGTIGSSKVYSTIDLLQGFHQIYLDEESSPLTGFSSGSNHFEFVRMPFGLKSSPITFVRLIDSVFKGLMGKACVVYIDDLIILGQNESDHLRNLELVLERLLEANLKLKISKCSFFLKEVAYLGHKITASGIQVTDDKIRAIVNYPRPTNTKAVKSFLGVSGFYRCFVEGYSKIALPLTNLLRKDVPFSWNEEQEEAFDALKTALTTPPILAFPDFSKEFILSTDASDFGIGSCLMQIKDHKKMNVIAYYSRKMNQAEINYSVTDKESLAVVASLKHFRYLIFGHRVTVYTDHTAVRGIFNNPTLSGRRARWFEIAQDYDVQYRYIPGRQNHVADALSRQFSENQVSSASCKRILTDEKIRLYQDRDVNIDTVKRLLKDAPNSVNDQDLGCPNSELRLIDDILVRETKLDFHDLPDETVIQIIIPDSLIEEVVQIIHDDRAHPGRDETIRQCRFQYYWKTMIRDITGHIEQCNRCAEHKGNSNIPVPMSLYPVPQRPFERVHIDLLTNFSETMSGHKHIMVCIDALTRFTELIPLKNKTAECCAIAFHEEYILRYSAPEVLVSDNGLEFVNSIMKRIAENYQIKHVNIMPYRPQGNGLAERTVRKVLNILRLTIGNHDQNWDTNLRTTQNILNTTVHTSIKRTPFQALFGVNSRLPFESSKSKHSGPVSDDPISSRIKNSEAIRESLRTKLMESNVIMQKRQHTKAKECEFQIGELVYVKNYVVSGANYKLGAQFSGPFKIIEKLKNHKYRVEHLERGHIKTFHAERMKLFKGNEIKEIEKQRLQERESLKENTEDEESEDEISEESEEEEILDERRKSKRLQDKPIVNYDEGV